MRDKFSALPKREYCLGKTEMFSMRLPETLRSQLEKIAKDGGWTLSDTVALILDQYVVWHNSQNSKHRRSR